ncbi:uncharacterized protein LOC126988562 [Eriocheir sinensis]|uniref:uncharacterized protein LOC126988562 n=1 Tax=Eriocheir sinensis TaxID=95602 RepID=UPI0021C72E32|nr:uncharacterized protein LOC126988562 [Eriocheir sinensis]
MKGFIATITSLATITVILHTQPTQATYLTSTNHDLLSAFTWASLDLPHPGVDLFTPGEGLGLSPVQTKLAEGRRRKRRQILFEPGKEYEPIFIEVEARVIVPMFQVFEGNNMNFEVPYVYEMPWPQLLRRSGEMEWQNAVGGMLRDLEDMITMFGVDGSGCVRRALCEVATLPPLRPQGIMGEMLDIFVRGMGNSTDEAEPNEIYKEEEEEEMEELYDEEEEEEEEGRITTTNTTNTHTNTRTNTQTEKDKEEEEEELNRKTSNRRKEGDEEKEEEEEMMMKKRRRRRRRRSPIDNNSNNNNNNKKMDYMSAGTYGKLDGDCARAFPECPVSLLDSLAASPFFSSSSSSSSSEYPESSSSSSSSSSSF